METRKLREIEFHNKLRDESLKSDPVVFDYLRSNLKYYSVTAQSVNVYKSWLVRHCGGKVVLDYGCGDGGFSILLAKNGARRVVGIDISDVSVENCRRRAVREGLIDRMAFEVMDCESMTFDDESFDIVCEAGVLHHLDLCKAISEIRRVLKPNGQAICYEALGHNPLIQLYRRLTPHLRTEYEAEHILRTADVRMMREFFGRIDARFFHLVVLAAVPFRNWPGFSLLRGALEALDTVLMHLPLVRRQAWMMILVLSQPRRVTIERLPQH